MKLNSKSLGLIIIRRRIKIFLKRKILSLETILGADIDDNESFIELLQVATVEKAELHSKLTAT